MSSIRPIVQLDTHEVLNQPPPFEDVNLFTGDRALADAVARAGGAQPCGGARSAQQRAAQPRQPRRRRHALLECAHGFRAGQCLNVCAGCKQRGVLQRFSVKLRGLVECSRSGPHSAVVCKVQKERQHQPET